jgi:hypothetical protein
VTLRYSPCDDTPTAATIALTTGGVSLLFCKNIFIYFHTPPCLAIHGHGDTPPVITATVAAVGVLSHGRLCTNESIGTPPYHPLFLLDSTFNTSVVFHQALLTAKMLLVLSFF